MSPLEPPASFWLALGAIVAGIAAGAWLLGRALKKQRAAQMPGGILLVDPPQVTFGVVSPGETAVWPIAITNRSGRAMRVSKVSVSGVRFGRRFGVEGLPALPAILENGERLEFDVRFAPTNPCRCSAKLVIETREPERRWKVAIAGRAISAEAGSRTALAERP